MPRGVETSRAARPMWIGLATLISVMTMGGRTSWALDKVQCIQAHESAQELRNRQLLSRTREQLFICSDDRCPALVRADCGAWLQQVEAALQAMAPASGRVANDPTEQATPLGPAAPAPANGGCDSAAPSGKASHAVSQPRPWSAQAAQAAPVRGTTEHLSAMAHSSPAAEGAQQTRFAFLHSPVLPGVVASVALASGAIFAITGLSQAQDLRHSCSPNCSPDDVSAVRRKLVAADVSVAVALGFGVLTGWMIWDARYGSGSSREREGQPRGFSATATGTSVHLNYAGHF